MENSPSIAIEGFELLNSLGGGSMGEVYRARDLSNGRLVALKFLYPVLAGNMTYLQRFQAEAEAAHFYFAKEDPPKEE